MNTETVVLYPGPGISHVISMVELGKLILRHHGPNISMTILLTTGFMDSPSVDSYIASISDSHPSISFLRFPHLGADPEILRRHSFAAVIFDFVNRSAPNFRSSLLEIAAARGRVKAVLIDMFCAAALRVARELEVPVYYFFASGASTLAACLYLPTILDKSGLTKRVRIVCGRAPCGRGAEGAAQPSDQIWRARSEPSDQIASLRPPIALLCTQNCCFVSP